MEAPGTPGGGVLKDVVAYVEVWSVNGTENYSKTFTNQLVDMGAKVSKTFNKQVTHVVFKDGYQSTWDKAQKRGVKLVSVLWVEKCRTAGVHIDESLFPAANTREHLPSLIKKKRKCMQPKDFIPKTPEHDKRLQKKFQKMATELQRQKTTLDNDVPVLLFESNGSLVYSPTIKMCSGQHNTMQKRLQQMKEKRENLSPTSSQLLEKSHDDPFKSPCEAWNISRDTLCSDESFAGALDSSFDNLSGNSGCGSQERRVGEVVDESRSGVCVSSPALKTGSVHSSAPAGPSASLKTGSVHSSAPAGPSASLKTGSVHSSAPAGHLSQLTPQNPSGRLSEQEVSRQRDPAGEAVTPDTWSGGAPREVFGMKHGLPPTLSATERHPWGHSRSESSSAKRRRKSEISDSSPTGRLKKRCRGKPGVSQEWLLADSRPLEGGSTEARELMGAGSVRKEDRPRTKRESCGGTQPDDRLGFAGDCTADTSAQQREDVCRGCSESSLVQSAVRNTFLQAFPCGDNLLLEHGWRADRRSDGGFEHLSAHRSEALDARRIVRQCEHCFHQEKRRLVADMRRTPQPRRRSERARLSLQAGCCSTLPRVHSPLGPGARGRPRGASTGRSRGLQMSASSDVGCHTAACSQGPGVTELHSEKQTFCVKNGPARPDVLDGSLEGCQDLARPHEKSKKRGRGQKPTRTLVMTSMPSETQNIVIQVVNTLKGFSLAQEVCETTTHVLAGKPLRTLNVLLGIARGCWVLSYEWVLWSLELGHWISEEPFELSNYFPAAPVSHMLFYYGEYNLVFSGNYYLHKYRFRCLLN
ncbi:microcephalin-like [Lynx pardinus]|uniref:Microcephalin n=1 Tax=Lynx pardinus TaxID=191816 RepID=A0A485PHU7_LYNPA|nr:microcephalin-like [Lynx pardinus]